jgi:hypothetical protein
MVISLDEFGTAVATGRGSATGPSPPIAVLIVILVAVGTLLWSRLRQGPGT